jgi:hypothetical protein
MSRKQRGNIGFSCAVEGEESDTTAASIATGIEQQAFIPTLLGCWVYARES